jgi:hypothetical protein
LLSCEILPADVHVTSLLVPDLSDNLINCLRIRIEEIPTALIDPPSGPAHVEPQPELPFELSSALQWEFLDHAQNLAADRVNRVTGYFPFFPVEALRNHLFFFQHKKKYGYWLKGGRLQFPRADSA